jgi:hypothetical protein
MGRKQGGYNTSETPDPPPTRPMGAHPLYTAMNILCTTLQIVHIYHS